MSSGRGDRLEKLSCYLQRGFGDTQLFDFDQIGILLIVRQERLVSPLIVEIINMLKIDLYNPRADQRFKAVDTWRKRTVKRRSVNVDTVSGRVGDRIHFGVNGAGKVTRLDSGNLVLRFTPETFLPIRTVPGSRRSTVVSGGEDSFVPRDNRSDRTRIAC